MPIKYSDRKTKQWTQIQECVANFNKMLFVDVDNVTSKQICIMRKALREQGSRMIMGKNTLLRASLAAMNAEPQAEDDDYEQRKDSYVFRPEVEIISKQLNLNTGIIFTNGDLSDVKTILDSQVREAPARVGLIAPSDVIVPPGPTGLDPKQTGFFQALSIQTKIVKAQIEIVNPVTVIQEGDKISSSQAALLEKLKIRPFEFKMHIKNVLDNGKLFPAAVLSISNESLLETFRSSAANLTALSLGSGYVIPSAAPHLIMNAFKNLVAVTMVTDYSFPAAEALKAAASAAPVASAAAAGGAPAEEAAEEKVEEEDVDVDMGDMFGDDDY